MNGSYNPDVYAEGELVVRATAEDSSVVQPPKGIFFGSGELNFVNLGEIAKIYSGGTPSRGNYGYWNIPWVKTTQIQSRVIFKADIDEYITEEGLKKSSAKVAPQGTILMAMYGQGKTRGRVGLLGINAAINQACCAIEPYEDISSEYVFQYLVFSYAKIRELSNDGSQKNLNAGIVKKLKIFLPSLPEQKEIANVLQTCDATVKKTEELIAAKEKQFDWLKYKLITCNPRAERWEIKDLNCFMNESIILHGRRTATVAAVGKRGIRDRSEVYSKELSKDYTKNKLVRNNEIAFGLASDSIVYGVNLSDQSVYSVSPAYRVFSISECDSAFLKYFLDANNRRFSLKYLITSARQGKSIDFRGLFNERIKFPSLTEQKRIAETLNTARQEIDTLKALAGQYRTQKRGLMQKLLTGKWRVRTENNNQYIET